MKKILSKVLIITVFVYSIFVYQAKADEGMWIPILLEKYTIEDMQKKGFKLTAEDIYSINKACMKDGIVIFGRGCTGELISDQGLLITNHHCGFGQIQSHSSVEHDYLTDGFWAMSQKEELANPGLTVTFLVRMEDVTDRVFNNIDSSMTDQQRTSKIKVAINQIQIEESAGTHYEAEVNSFYSGNQYYLFIYEIYKDIRLVGAPPSAIGKFGGDTDNWMWPRHTGDFSLFRIYADKENKPAEYNDENVPYKPKYHFAISLDGVKKGDFTMVFGYPGRTQQFLTSYAVKQLIEKVNPSKIAVRDKILNIMKSDMEADPAIRIQYASKAASVANSWKKWIGENRGLIRLDAVEKKQELEKQFQNWANADEDRKNAYGDLLSKYEDLYKSLEPYQLTIDYTHETFFALDIIDLVGNFSNIDNLEGDVLKDRLQTLGTSAKLFFRDYNLSTDKKLFATLLTMYYENVDKSFHPEIFTEIEKKFKGDFNKYADYAYSKSIFVNENKTLDFIKNYSDKSEKVLLSDPFHKLYESIVDLYTMKLLGEWRSINSEIENLNRLYIKALMEMQNDKIFYPDANFTMRITYGKIDDYIPMDAVKYNYYTTLSGIIEKDNPEIYDYDVPEKLRELYDKKDYGIYGVNDTMYVCFTGTNHTTGGNSGSPVLNANGQLIGVNFDRNWEGTMSDIMYDPDMCRNISLDIRYALFIIDKMAGARHLIDEMTIVRSE
ncbi:MAG: S46 family peptidase [Bacteroidota bacterium]